jgi:hypothetical protein
MAACCILQLARSVRLARIYSHPAPTSRLGVHNRLQQFYCISTRCTIFLTSGDCLCHSRRMGRRPAITQASIARAIRAAKANGAAVVEVQHPDGAIIRILVNAPPHVPEQDHSANCDIIL